MDLFLLPDTYTPSVNNNGDYIDNMDNLNNLNNGIKCPCGSTKTFKSKSNLSTHFKTERHKKWLLNLNNNKQNYYVENENNKKIIEEQKKIISQLEKENKKKSLHIDNLLDKVLKYKNNEEEIELILFD